MDEVSPSNEAEPQAQDLSIDVKESPQSSLVSWRPSPLAFGAYPSKPTYVYKPHNLRVVVKRSLVTRLTKDIVETYNACNPQFRYSEELNPKRYLTSPSVGVLNDGYDNANSDLILIANFILANPETQRRYVVKDVLGHGTFGQVAKCWVPEIGNFVAVKIIKNQPAYYQQALVEVSILTMLNKKYDPEDKHHIVRIYDYFVYRRHLCICFELLGTNLYELIKINHFRGLSLSIVQLFSKQILKGLSLLKDAAVIHCDLKPENILLCTSMKPAEIKIIDFGSACMEDRTVYSYIQSRYYRSPEVLLGYQYTTAIDMWSFGCIVAELFLGLPLFPGASEFDLLHRMIKILGEQPPDYVLKEAKNTSKFFKCVGSAHNSGIAEASDGASVKSIYEVLSEEEYEVRELKKPNIGKEYFNHMNLDAIVKNYPYLKNLTNEDIIKENQSRMAFIDFLRGLVEFDPAKRWSPFQASRHPFVTGEPFKCPYKPPLESSRLVVAQNIKVNHHPGGGHWFAAGLSPNITGRNRIPQHSSPSFQVVSRAHASSYGSLGSHGSSYNDGAGLGSSYGSYGDGGNMFAYYSPVGPSAMNLNTQGSGKILGTSPDARRRMVQLSHGNSLGVSPSGGSFPPLPLGTSPSQFTPPGSYSQFPIGSPGHYGPTSPARGNIQGSPLGKPAFMGQMNRRKSRGYSGNAHVQECSSSLLWQGHHMEGSSLSQAESSSQTSNCPLHLHAHSTAMSRKQQSAGTVFHDGLPVTANMCGSLRHGSSGESCQAVGAVNDITEADLSLPDPGDWDPNYSDELLLQEDASDVSLAAEFGAGMHLGSSESLRVGRNNHVSAAGYSLSTQRRLGAVQTFADGEVGKLSYDPHSGHIRATSEASHFMPQYSYSSLSRLGQQPTQKFNHGRPTPTFTRGSEWHSTSQPPNSSFNSGPHSPGSGSFINVMSWGHRANDPIAGIPPTSRGRRDYGKFV
ncbi:hypothetical protein SAY86_022589 [Trapa natans]|uniref:Protein kinase domain-containing protein n=1 Tax=Trapa natans TaxID=22666 RepID=A0AAN7R4L5_TRANT|nr:hypothetical protein SAY86_022589 [Trapa natans]